MPRPNNWKFGDPEESLVLSDEDGAFQMLVSYLEEWSARQSAMLMDAHKTIAAAKAALHNTYVSKGSGVSPCVSHRTFDLVELANEVSTERSPLPDESACIGPTDSLRVKRSRLHERRSTQGAATPATPATPRSTTRREDHGYDFHSYISRRSSNMALVEAPPSKLPRSIKRLADYLTTTAGDLLDRYPQPNALLARAIRGRAFEMFFVGVILVNVLVLILSTDDQIQSHVTGDNHNEKTFFALDVVFTCIYVIELACRVYAHRLRFVLTTDWRWNLLDTFLTGLAVQDVVVVASEGSKSKSNVNFLRLIRLLKLLKTLRLLRVLRAFRDLRIMLNSIVGSIYVMGYALVLIVVVMFAFGIFLSQGVGIYLSENSGGDAQDLLIYYWGSVAISMASLYMAVLGGENWRNMADSLIIIGQGFRLAFFAFVAFFLLVIVNTVTSVFVESAIQAGEKDSHSAIKEEMEKIHSYVAQFKDIFKRMDLNNDGVVDFDELLASLERQEMIALMSKLMIDIHDAKQFLTEVSIQGQQDINLDSFVAQCMKIRGPARSIDLISFAAAQQNANAAILREISALKARSEPFERINLRQ